MNRFPLWAATLAAALALLSAGCDDSPSGPDNSPLTEEEILAVAPPEFEVLLAAYQNVRASHPEISEESNAFARLLLEEVESLAATRQNRIPGEMALGLLQRLTLAEWLLIMTPTNWTKALPMRDIANESHAAAAAEFPSASLEDGTGDAFRHAYWNVRMAQRFGVDWARDFATAHESETPDGNRKTMDLNNNQVGRNIFSSNPEATTATLAGLIKSHPVACQRENTSFDAARLVYVKDCPTIEVFDDGPDFDDTYAVTLGSTPLGTTPSGSGRKFETSNLLTGIHALLVQCTVDGTRGGCGFKVRLEKGLTFGGATTITTQQVVSQGGSRTFPITTPNLEQLRTLQSAALAPIRSEPLQEGARP